MASPSHTTLNSASWGVSGTCSVSGIITSLRVQSDGMFQAETDDYGSVCRQILYDLHSQVTVQVIVSPTDELPEIGGPITIMGYRYYVRSGTIIETNMTYRKFQIVAEKYGKCETAERVGLD